MTLLIAVASLFLDCLHVQTFHPGFDLEAYLQERESRNAEHAFASSSRAEWER